MYCCCSLFQSPAHFGLLLTGKDGAVLDLKGLLTSEDPAKVSRERLRNRPAGIKFKSLLDIFNPLRLDPFSWSSKLILPQQARTVLLLQRRPPSLGHP